MRETAVLQFRAAAENYLAPNVASLRVLGCSKTVEWCHLNEYEEEVLMLTISLMYPGDMPWMALK